MADITMCDNPRCGIRDECYRANAPVSDWQSWAIFPLEDEENPQFGCSFFIERVPHTRESEKSKEF